MFKFFIFAVAIQLPLIIIPTNGEMEKRQVGVLARTGVLPQGKRSVQALARGGELPGKRMLPSEQQRLWDVINYVQQREAALELQRELEQEVVKRNMEAMARAGYLVKPATENPPSATDFFDSEEFLGKTGSDWLAENESSFDAADNKRGGFASLARNGYIGKRDEDTLDEDLSGLEDKRNIGAAKNFITPNDKRHLASMKNFISHYGKRHVGSFRNLSTGKRHLGSALKFATVKKDFDFEPNEWEESNEEKRNVGSARRFNGKRNVGAARNFIFNEMKKNLLPSVDKKNVGAARNFWYGKRSLASFARDGGFSHLKHYGKDSDYPWDDDDFDFDDFHDNDKRHIASFIKNLSGKRYLGSLRAGKRNVASFKNFGKRLNDADSLALASALFDAADEDVDDFLGKELDGALSIEKREVNDEAEQKEGHSDSVRMKRSAEFVFPSGDFSTPELHDYNDYEDEFITNNLEKRFLGSDSTLSEITDVSKRHIGALARLGLLPSFRSSRYSRSGRAIDSRIIPYRETPSAWACAAEGPGTGTSRSTATPASTQLALRRQSSWVSEPIRTRHPMSFYRSIH